MMEATIFDLGTGCQDRSYRSHHSGAEDTESSAATPMSAWHCGKHLACASPPTWARWCCCCALRSSVAREYRWCSGRVDGVGAAYRIRSSWRISGLNEVPKTRTIGRWPEI